MRKFKLISLAISFGAVGALLGGVALSLDGESVKTPQPAAPFDDASYEATLIAGRASLPSRAAEVLRPHQTGERDYRQLELLVFDGFTDFQVGTLKSLGATSTASTIARVTNVAFEVSSFEGLPRMLVTYEPEENIYGPGPMRNFTRYTIAGPEMSSAGTYFLLMPFGVRPMLGERYLLLINETEPDRWTATTEQAALLLDGDRIANSEAARALGIEGKNVSDVIAELRRLKRQ